jgi:methyltransferase (TIGR00027 family)
MARATRISSPCRWNKARAELDENRPQDAHPAAFIFFGELDMGIAKQVDAPERTALRVALWRALHVEIDPPPHVLSDVLGLEIAAPDAGWRKRPDMNPRTTARARVSIVARARFIEDLVAQEAAHGVEQYAILGAGLDTFAVRRPELAATLRIFEIDQPAPQAWKRRRLDELGLSIPDSLHFVPVDFEAGDSWIAALTAAGFQPDRPAVIAAAGLAMYLSAEANAALLHAVAAMAVGSTLALTFMAPLDLVEPAERPGREATEKYARAAGTPFLSLFTPEEIIALAHEAGFSTAEHVSQERLTQLYFTERTDGLRPSSSESLLLAHR